MDKDKSDKDAQLRADEVIDNADRDYRGRPEESVEHREELAGQQQRPMTVHPLTGVALPNDFDGTPPEEIAKMAIHRTTPVQPLGPGQVTGGGSVQGGKPNAFADDEPAKAAE